MTSSHALLEAAIADLEARRDVLGDAVVDAAIGALRAQAATAVPASVAHGADIAYANGGAAAPPGAPRLRQVSILFVDVAESTAMLQHLPAEAALPLISDALERFAAVVREQDGEVLRYTGDGLKAAFGVHGVREDEAERAVRAGLGLIGAAEAHARAVKTSHGVAGFGVRVGVHTGPVVLGGGAEADRTAMGHAVHLAARLEQNAPVGRLRISHETWTQVRGLFRVEPQPPLVVKGHDVPLVTYLVRGALADPERAAQRGVEGVATPMVGRAAELRALLALHKDSVARATTCTAWVVADAGLGKTRLRRELQQLLAQRGTLVLQARAHPSSALQPYGLVRQLLTRWLGIPDDLGADAARARFVDGVAGRLADEAVARAERLGHLLGLDFAQRPSVQALGGRELREQGFGALREALSTQAARGPLLVVLDDLHWADAASIEFVNRLAAEGIGAALLVLLTRPALLERLPAAAHETAGPAPLRLVLHPLAVADGRVLADALLAPLKAPASALHELLVGRAEGNPYYMEELLRMLVDDGVVDARQRPWRVRAERWNTLRVPETLVGVLQARLDALPAEELVALQHASIVGSVFWDTALAELDAAAPAALPALCRRAVVVEREGSAFARAGEFAFHHALLHEVTYGTVLARIRREGHARVARWLAANMGERAGEFLAMTADHFERAGESASALDYLDRARRLAGDLFAHEAALQLIDRALAQPALVHPRWRFQLLVSRHTELYHQSRLAECDAALQAMSEHAQACDDDTMRADVLTSRMLRADHEGRPDEAREHALEALRLVARSGNETGSGPAALAHGELAWLALQRLDFDEVHRQLAQGLVHARVCATLPNRIGGYEGYELQLHIIEIDALQRQERYLDTQLAVDEALEALSRLSKAYPHDRFNFLLLRGVSQRHLGELDDADETVRQLLDLAAQLQVPRLHTAALELRTELALVRGDAFEARRSLDEAERVAQDAGHEFALPGIGRQRGALSLLLDDRDAARQHWQMAVEQMQQQSRDHDVLQLRCELAALEWQLCLVEAASAAVERSLDEASADRRPAFRALDPAALLSCWHVLAGLGDARADGLRRALCERRDDQLAQLAAVAEGAALAARRHRLLDAVPHWRALQRALGEASASVLGQEASSSTS